MEESSVSSLLRLPPGMAAVGSPELLLRLDLGGPFDTGNQ